MIVSITSIMIRDQEAYARMCEAEKWEALRAMSIDESIAVARGVYEATALPGGDRPLPSWRDTFGA